MKSQPATHDEVKEIVQTEIKESERRLVDKLDEGIKESERRLSNKMDALMGEVKNMREDFTLIQGKYDTINELEDIVEDHDKQLKKLMYPTP